MMEPVCPEGHARTCVSSGGWAPEQPEVGGGAWVFVIACAGAELPNNYPRRRTR